MLHKIKKTATRFFCVALCFSILLSVPVVANAEGQSLDTLISEFLLTNNLDENKISFAYFNTVTGEEYMYNENKMMVAASIYKLPLNMYYYEQEALGNISPNTKFAGYKLSDCHRLSLQYSDNNTSMAMRKAFGSYSTYKIALDKYTGVSAAEIGGQYLTANYFSALTIINTLKYLYENSVFFDEAIGYLHAATPGQYFEKYVNDYDIAQKYGQITDVVNTAGIIYTPTPYLLCVFTQNTTYAERIIGRLNELFCEYTVSTNSANVGKALFYDVRTKDWFYEYLKKAVELGLISGIGNGKFGPSGYLKICEAIKLSCVIHSEFTGVSIDSTTAPGEAWYQPYIDYAATNGLIGEGEFENYNRDATRAEMAGIFGRALVTDGDVFETSEIFVPDMDIDNIYGKEVYLLYALGILTGTDAAGNFKPYNTITRAEAATVAVRSAVAEMRII